MTQLTHIYYSLIHWHMNDNIYKSHSSPLYELAEKLAQMTHVWFCISKNTNNVYLPIDLNDYGIDFELIDIDYDIQTYEYNVEAYPQLLDLMKYVQHFGSHPSRGGIRWNHYKEDDSIPIFSYMPIHMYDSAPILTDEGAMKKILELEPNFKRPPIYTSHIPDELSNLLNTYEKSILIVEYDKDHLGFSIGFKALIKHPLLEEVVYKEGDIIFHKIINMYNNPSYAQESIKHIYVLPSNYVGINIYESYIKSEEFFSLTF